MNVKAITDLFGRIQNGEVYRVDQNGEATPVDVRPESASQVFNLVRELAQEDKTSTFVGKSQNRVRVVAAGRMETDGDEANEIAAELGTVRITTSQSTKTGSFITISSPEPDFSGSHSCPL